MTGLAWAALAAAAEPPPDGGTPDEPHVSDGFDAFVLGEDYDEPERAVRWLLDHRDDDPASAKNLWRALRLMSWLPTWRTPALPAQVEAWAAAHPEAQDVAVARLYASHAALLLPTVEASPLYVGMEERAWCARAAELLAALPEAPLARVSVLDHRVRLADACGQPTGPLRAELDAYRATGEAGPSEQVHAAVVDGVDEADLALIDAAIAEPRMVWNLAWLARPTTEGPAAPAARDRLLAAAAALATSDRLGAVDAARAVFHAAERRDDERQALERLLAFLPDNRVVARRLERMDVAADPADGEDAAEPEVAATTLVDPAARCAALAEEPVPGDAFGANTHWAAVADCSAELGDFAAATDARERIWRARGDAAAFGEAALRSGTRLRPALRAVDAAVERALGSGSYTLDPDGDASWREDLARLLVVRADLTAATGGSPRADLAAALHLDGPAPDRLLRLGLAVHDDADGDERTEALAASLLGRALATLPPADPRIPPTREVLAGILADTPGWTPDVDAYVAGSAPPPEPRSEAPELPQPDLAGFVVTLGDPAGGEVQQELLALEGPLVVDLWATWCGPCMESLPHLDTLARRFAGRATFVALSVDDDRAKAERYLARRGAVAFRSAWNADGRDRFGVDGIPATFVFDAEHRVVAAFLGWGPGDTRLDEALVELLGP